MEKPISPFFFPPETNARFTLLIIAAISLAIILGSYLPEYLNSSDQPMEKKFKSSQIELNKPDDITKLGEKNLSDASGNSGPLLITALILIIMFLVTIYIYKSYPSAIIKSQKLIPLDSSKYSELNKAVNNISEQYKISTPQIFIANSFSAGGQAFGTSKHSKLRLDKGLSIVLKKNPDKFKSILLHEMGHIVNKDIFKMYFSNSIWKAALYLFVVPTILFIFIAFTTGVFNKIKLSAGLNANDIKSILLVNIPSVIVILLSVILSFLILYWILTGLVRIREYYADWRASSSGGKESLLKYFQDNAVSEKPKSFFKKLFSWHPSIKDRIKALDDPSVLFIIKKDIPFLAGFLIAQCSFSFLTIMNLVMVLSQTLSGIVNMIGSDILVAIFTPINFLITASLLFFPVVIGAYFISSSIGVQIQKSIIYFLANNDNIDFNFKSIFISSALMTAGAVLGTIIVPLYSPLNKLITAGIIDFLVYQLKFLILTVILSFVANLIWMFYLKLTTPKLYSKYTGNKSPKLRYYMFNFASAIFLALLYIPVAVNLFLFYSDSESSIYYILISILAIPLISLVFYGITGIAMFIINSSEPKCPNCKTIFTSGNPLGKQCSNCKNHVTHWLYAEM